MNYEGENPEIYQAGVCMVWFFSIPPNWGAEWPCQPWNHLHVEKKRSWETLGDLACAWETSSSPGHVTETIFSKGQPLSSWIEKQDPTLHAAYMENRKHSVDFLRSFFFQDVNNMLRTRNSKRKKQAKWMAMIGRLPNNFKSPLSLKGLPFTAWSMRLVALAGVDTPWSQRESQISTSLTGMWDPKIYRKLNPTTMELHLVQHQSKKNRWNGPIVENM